MATAPAAIDPAIDTGSSTGTSTGPGTGRGPAGLRRVLLVDDSPWLRHSVRHLLEHAGLVVVEAADGAHALAQAAKHDPDVVLMDLRMPAMDGIAATRALHQQQPTTPVVLWTSAATADLAAAVRRAGAQAGLTKGIPAAELLAILQAVWTQAHQPS